VFQVALEASGLSPADAMVVGDTVWDVESAARSGLSCVAVLSGGIGRQELEEAGAKAVYEDAADLLRQLDDSPLGHYLPG
jgi:phosphoglycolate phosphatase-like HAD superfamily hydrolase